jgi:hypothetical protein
MLILFVALVSPQYVVRVEVDTPTPTKFSYFYHFLYQIQADGNASNVNVTFEHSVGWLVVMGISSLLNALTCLLLVFVALRSNRARIFGTIILILALASALEMLFIPLVFPTCEFPASTAAPKDNPCHSIWGDSGNMQWGTFYGWYLIVIGVVGCVIHLILGIAAPNPKEDDEYTPLTGYA